MFELSIECLLIRKDTVIFAELSNKDNLKCFNLTNYMHTFFSGVISVTQERDGNLNCLQCESTCERISFRPSLNHLKTKM